MDFRIRNGDVQELCIRLPEGKHNTPKMRSKMVILASKIEEFNMWKWDFSSDLAWNIGITPRKMVIQVDIELDTMGILSGNQTLQFKSP